MPGRFSQRHLEHKKGRLSGGELGKHQSKEWYSQTAIPFFFVLAVFVLVIACSKSNAPIKL
ncbi:MAG TPA: hypothetical protein H9790_02185, partial [Candidatus Agathobaculum intestinipullorum]|nr:hypothetical protein [Candidatus Agathobaculum intestinipullorum]